MLYNPDWNKPTVETDPFALDSLIAWAEKQYPHAHYDYKNCGRCFLAQYFSDCGYNRVEVSKNFVKHWEKGLILSQPTQAMLPDLFNWIAEEAPHTFGAAAERAKMARDNRKEAFKQKNLLMLTDSYRIDANIIGASITSWREA